MILCSIEAGYTVVSNNALCLNEMLQLNAATKNLSMARESCAINLECKEKFDIHPKCSRTATKEKLYSFLGNFTVEEKFVLVLCSHIAAFRWMSNFLLQDQREHWLLMCIEKITQTIIVMNLDQHLLKTYSLQDKCKGKIQMSQPVHHPR